MGSELKPCPFCRSSDLIDVSEGPRDTGPFYIGCKRCGARGPETDNGRDASAELWNAALRCAEVVKLPRDADGVPIKPGDVLYGIPGTAAEKFQDQKVIRIEFGRNGEVALCTDSGPRDAISPRWYTRTKPDSLDDIERDMSRLVSSGYLDDPKGEAKAIVNRIRRLREAGE